MSQDTTIFAFHNVSDRFNIGFNNISINKFINIIRYIDFLSKTSNIEICFDDAYEDVFTNIYKSNLSFKVNKTIFPITNYLGRLNTWDVNFFYNRKKHINREQLKELSKNYWNIGSHGHNHISYKSVREDEIYNDMLKSKEILEDIINKEVDTFTPPFGYFRPKMIKILEKVGYKKLYLNKYYLDEFSLVDNVCIYRRLPVYSVDNERSINRKFKDNIYQDKFDQIVHSCSRATVFVKNIT